MILRLSVAHVQFGEDPVTQIVDLLVIKDTPPTAPPKPQTNSNCALLNPGLTHFVTHAPQSPCGMTDMKE